MKDPLKRKKKSRKLEKRTMKRLGGQVQPGSGCFDGLEDDGRVPFQVRVEHKYTTRGKYSFHLDKWEMLDRRATRVGEKPIFVMDFVPEKKCLAIMHSNDVEELEVWKGVVPQAEFLQSEHRSMTIRPEMYSIDRTFIFFEQEELGLELVPFWRVEGALKNARGGKG